MKGNIMYKASYILNMAAENADSKRVFVGKWFMENKILGRYVQRKIPEI